MADFNVFQTINGVIGDSMDQIVEQLQKGWVQGIVDVTTVSVTLYVLFYGYMVIAGKIQTPIPDLVWNLSRFAFLLCVINNEANILTMANGAVEDIKAFFTGSNNLYAGIDDQFGKVFDRGIKIWDKAEFFTPGLQAILQLAAFVPLLIGYSISAALIVVSDIVTKILLATAPIFIFCLMWGFLRDSFNRWLSTILGNCLVLLFSIVIMKFTFKLIDNSELMGDNFLLSMIISLVAGVLNIAMAKWGREMAMQIASVSVSAAGAGIGTQMARNSWAATRAGARAARSSAKAAQATYRYVTRRGK